MGAQRLAAALLLLVTSVISPANANFHHGDYIQVARKAQFQSVSPGLAAHGQLQPRAQLHLAPLDPSLL